MVIETDLLREFGEYLVMEMSLAWVKESSNSVKAKAFVFIARNMNKQWSIRLPHSPSIAIAFRLLHARRRLALGPQI
jgi:hypothetical protein